MGFCFSEGAPKRGCGPVSGKTVTFSPWFCLERSPAWKEYVWALANMIHLAFHHFGWFCLYFLGRLYDKSNWYLKLFICWEVSYKLHLLFIIWPWWLYHILIGCILFFRMGYSLQKVNLRHFYVEAGCSTWVLHYITPYYSSLMVYMVDERYYPSRVRCIRQMESAQVGGCRSVGVRWNFVDIEKQPGILRNIRIYCKGGIHFNAPS
jgi:hypothetical protein